MTKKPTGRKPTGRPWRQASSASSVRVMLRLTPEEHAELQRLGALVQLSPPQLMRLIALGALGTARAVDAGETTLRESREALAVIRKDARRRAAAGSLQPEG